VSESYRERLNRAMSTIEYARRPTTAGPAATSMTLSGLEEAARYCGRRDQATQRLGGVSEVLSVK